MLVVELIVLYFLIDVLLQDVCPRAAFQFSYGLLLYLQLISRKVLLEIEEACRGRSEANAAIVHHVVLAVLREVVESLLPLHFWLRLLLHLDIVFALVSMHDELKVFVIKILQ